MSHPYPEASFRKNHPLRNPKDLQQVPATVPMDREWNEVQAQQWWSTHYQGTKPLDATEQRMLVLRDLLLTFGGQQVCLINDEPDLEQLIAEGEAWEATGLKFKRGESRECHRNSLLLWETNSEKLRYATGYALSADGMWRQHSWCVWPNRRGGRVVETTTSRVLYFGILYTAAETRSSCAKTV